MWKSVARFVGVTAHRVVTSLTAVVVRLGGCWSQKRFTSNSPNFHNNAFPKDHAALCNPTTTAVTTGRQGREVTEILECISKCCFSYWNAWVLVEAKLVQKWEVFLLDRPLMHYTGWLYKCTGSCFRKREMEKSQPSDITTPSQFCPIKSVLLQEPFGGDISLPALPLVLRDFFFVQSSADKLYNEKWWPKHRGSLPSRDLKLSCN